MYKPSRIASIIGLLSIALAVICGWVLTTNLSTTSVSLFDSSQTRGPKEDQKPQDAYGPSYPKLGF